MSGLKGLTAGVMAFWMAGCAGSGGEPPAHTPVAACAEPTGAPVEHSGTVSTAETWAASSPHLIRSDMTLRAAVTVEACAVVRLGAGLTVTVDTLGSLVAQGTQGRPVRFEPEVEGKPWGQLRLFTPGTVRLSWTTLRGAGNAAAALRVLGSTDLPGARPLFVEHVTLEDSAGPGVVLAGTTGFAPGSTDLTITRSGSEALPEPVALNPNALGTLPDGHYTGNRSDAIFVSASVSSSSVGYLGQDATVRAPGVPYRVEGLRVGNTGAQATLTLEPGVELRFMPGTRLEVYDSRSALVAVGTPERPVVFTSARATPHAGDWTGVSFGGTHPLDRLDSVRVLYAGGDCQCSSFGCNYLPGSFSVNSAILLFARPPTAFISHADIQHSAGHGILRGWNGSADPGFLEGNTFADVAECTQTLPRDSEGRCPATPACPRSP